MPSKPEIETQYGFNLDQIYADHNQLIGMILTEEEDLIEMHKQHVDDVINAEKTEMQLISEVEKSGSDIEDYVRNFDQMLVKKLNMISAVRRKLADFNAHL